MTDVDDVYIELDEGRRRKVAGASPHDVRRWVVKTGLRPVMVGLAAGLLLALAFTRGLCSLLYGTSPTDPGTYAGVMAVFPLVSLLATAVPALRASQADPMALLRRE